MNEELKYLDLLRGSNLSRDKSRLRKEIKGTSAKDVQAYAKEQDIPYSQAYKELSTYGLGTLIDKKGLGRELEIEDGRAVLKDRPTGFLGGLYQALDVPLQFFGTDLDKRGGGIGGMRTGLGYKPEDYNRKISKKGREKLEKEMLEKKLGELEYDPLGNLVSGSGTETSSSSGSVLDRLEEFNKRRNQIERGERRRDALEAQALQIGTLPIYTNLLADAAAKRLELDKAMLAAWEMMPSNIQNIMSKKQEQMNLAADSESRRALGTAAQQTAANQFGAAGIQRSFGNVS